MLIYFSILLIFTIFGFMLLTIERLKFKDYVKKMAESETIESIEKRIKEDIDSIENGNFSGEMLEMILDHKDLWEQVKKYKLNAKQDEDTIS